MNFITRFFARRAAKKKIDELSEDKLSLIASEFLTKTSEKYARTLRDAEKINKAKLFSEKERVLRRELAENLEDDDGEEEEEGTDSADEYVEKLVKDMLIKKFMGNSVNNGAAVGAPVAAQSSTAADAIRKLTLEDIELIKKKFLG